MKNLLFSGIVLCIFLIGCNIPSPSRNDFCPRASEFTIKDLSGLGTCGFVLENDEGEVFEPTNMDLVLFDVEEGDRHFLELRVQEDMSSSCMAGTIVEIICVRI